jgi:hypothetical protein
MNVFGYGPKSEAIIAGGSHVLNFAIRTTAECLA